MSMSSQEQHRALITGRIWQALAQSGVDMSAIPREQQEYLVGAIADGMLVTLDEMLGDIGQTAQPVQPAETEQTSAAPPLDGEQILWEGRPFLSLVESYVVTSERVRVKSGLLSNNYEDIELVRVKDLDFSQHLTERMLNIGDVLIRSADYTRPDVVLRNIKDPSTVHEIIRRAMLDARKRMGLIYREEM